MGEERMIQQTAYLSCRRFDISFYDWHRKWRALAKKMRRKRLRQRFAQERDKVLRDEQERKERSPRYQAWLSEQRALELFAEEEEAHQAAVRHAAWEAEEARAQKAWQERQEKIALAWAERQKQELRIREEWEEEQRKFREAQEEKDRNALEKQQRQEELMRHIENVINRGGDMPPDINVVSATNPDRPLCPFFTKTGACRFGDRCSRNHARPGISRVLLVPNFYDHIGLRQMNHEELEAADDWLEYEDSETYQHFLEFFEDVLPEWERLGTVSQFKVCCNFEPHLKGNVYVEYDDVKDAVKAFKLFHGRWYGGRQIHVEFVKIESWKAAICGQFHKQCCPKGRLCNFLHVFRNPCNAFRSADQDRQAWRRRRRRSTSRSPDGHARSWSRSPENSSRRPREWRWSASPSPPRPRRSSSRSSRSSRDSSAHRGQRARERRPGHLHSRERKRSHGSSSSRSSGGRRRQHHASGPNNGLHSERSRREEKPSGAGGGKDLDSECARVLSDSLRETVPEQVSEGSEEGRGERKEVPDSVHVRRTPKELLDRRKEKDRKKKKKKKSPRRHKRKKKALRRTDSPVSSSSDTRSSDTDS